VSRYRDDPRRLLAAGATALYIAVNIAAGIGPSTLLKSLLDASDLSINRGQATARADDVAPVMVDIVFDKAKTTLPTLCMTLVEGFPDDQRKQLGEQIAQLDSDPTVEPTAKTTILGAYLIRQFGAEVLARAVATLGDRIK
jgi:hypothetical protein